MMRWGAAALAVLAVAACGSGPMTYREMEAIGSDYQRSGVSPVSAHTDSCGVADHQALIGIEQSAVVASSLPAGARVICYRCAYTEDYSPSRLNVHIGADGKVSRLSCG